MPQRSVEKSLLDRDLVSTVQKKIDEPLHYEAFSSLSPTYKGRLDKQTLKAATDYGAAQNPKSYQEAQKIKVQYPNTQARAKAIVTFFKAQALTYTLKPDTLDTNHTTDSFLFDKKRGYCVHFASSFVTFARMSDIPARIVTGYKSDATESLNNYLAVKEKDAHAWAELYLDNAWVRYETTSTASNIDLQSQSLANAGTKQKEQNPLLKKINLYLMYTKYQIETWILYYSHVRQLQLLDYAKKNPQFVFGFVLSLIALVILSFIVVAYFKRPSYSSEALEALQPLLKRLKKEGLVRQSSESMHQFLLRCINTYPQKNALKHVDVLYEKISYKNDNRKEQKQALHRWVKKALKNISNK
jgi:hypothetical protein